MKANALSLIMIMMGSGDGVGDDGDEDTDDGVDDSFNLLASIRVPQFVGLNEGSSLR